MSPEVCENKPYGFASDMWAMGCVLYEMCMLKHAFDANNLLGLVWKIVQETYPPIPDMYSDKLRNLVKSVFALWVFVCWFCFVFLSRVGLTCAWSTGVC